MVHRVSVHDLESLGVAYHIGGMVMKNDIAYIQFLRDRAIGFEMEAFYDDLLKKMRDARFRQMMNEQEFFWW